MEVALPRPKQAYVGKKMFETFPLQLGSEMGYSFGKCFYIFTFIFWAIAILLLIMSKKVIDSFVQYQISAYIL